ncbi:hypothetical protein RND71_039645 [Anisodus tanguticus]|uniref:Uncharacterized protein n=1 Tax=Anisodus tanguticus TaxID=243964 RepID=A0AAE1QW79_9SOLA|nr:hypothetical protein RND71_039645 [Anisodus tanguticus]
MITGRGHASSSRGNKDKCPISRQNPIPTQDDFVDTEQFPTIPLDLDEELFSRTQ